MRHMFFTIDVVECAGGTIMYSVQTIEDLTDLNGIQYFCVTHQIEDSFEFDQDPQSYYLFSTTLFNLKFAETAHFGEGLLKNLKVAKLLRKPDL